MLFKAAVSVMVHPKQQIHRSESELIEAAYRYLPNAFALLSDRDLG